MISNIFAPQETRLRDIRWFIYLLIAIYSFSTVSFVFTQRADWQIGLLSISGGLFVCIAVFALYYLEQHAKRSVIVVLVTMNVLSAVRLVLVRDIELIIPLAVIILTFQLSVLALSVRLVVQMSVFSVLVMMLGLATLYITEAELALDLAITRTLPFPIAVIILSVSFSLSIFRFATYPLPIKFVMIFINIGFFIVISVTMLFTQIFSQAIRDYSSIDLEHVAEQGAEELDYFIQTKLSTVQIYTRLPQIRRLMSEPLVERREVQVEETLQVLRIQDQDVHTYRLVDRNGEIVVSSNPNEIGLDVSQELSFAQVQSLRQPYISPVRFENAAAPTPTFDISVPIVNEAIDFVGVLLIRFDAELLQRLIEGYNGLLSEQSHLLLLDEQDLFVAHGLNPDYRFLLLWDTDTETKIKLRQEKRITQFENKRLPLTSGFARLATNSSSSFTADVLDGEFNQLFVGVVSSHPLTTLPEWRVLSIQPEQFLVSEVRQQRYLLLIGLLLFVLLGIFASVAGANFIARPIVELTETANEIAKGNFDTPIPFDRQDEVGQLAKSLQVMTDQLNLSVQELETLASSRTQQLQMVLEISQNVNSMLDVGTILSQVVDTLKDRFEYYHVHIYLLDEDGENLTMSYGYGAPGEEMKRQGHQISYYARQSLVAQAARQVRSVTEGNVRSNPFWLPNPLLPDTHSELAVPIVSHGGVIGVLDVQSDRKDDFSSADEATLQALAHQVASAIRNVRQLAEREANVSQLQKLQYVYTGQVWERFASTRENTNFESRDLTLPPLLEIDTPEVQDVYQDGQTITRDASAVDEFSTPERTVATPLKLRDQTIGILGIRDTDPNRSWSDDDVALVESIAEQMSLAIDNARLFEETGRRAAREKVVADIIQKVWASGEFEAVLQTAAEQLGQTFNASKVIVHVGVPDKSEGDSSLQSG